MLKIRAPGSLLFFRQIYFGSHLDWGGFWSMLLLKTGFYFNHGKMQIHETRFFRKTFVIAVTIVGRIYFIRHSYK